MNKSINQHESISAMADGELSDAQLDSLLASLNDAECKDRWEVYHQIGDVLRSEELAITFSANFTERLSARLDEEPAILAPAALKKSQGERYGNKRKFLGAYAAVASVAAVAVLAIMMVPQLHDSQNDLAALSKSTPAGNVQLAAHNDAAAKNSLAMNVRANQASELTVPVNENKTTEIDMLRDPRIDSYLLAHQRFSPAINSGAQYVTHANAVSTASEK